MFSRYDKFHHAENTSYNTIKIHSFIFYTRWGAVPWGYILDKWADNHRATYRQITIHTCMHTPTNTFKFPIVLERTHAGCSKNMQTPHGKTSVPVDGTLLLLTAPTTAPLFTNNSNRNWKEKEIADLLEWSWLGGWEGGCADDGVCQHPWRFFRRSRLLKPTRVMSRSRSEG